MAPKKGFPSWPNIVFFLMTLVLAEDDLSLQMLSYSSSTVDLECRYKGNETELFFNVYRESDTCIFHKSTCQYYPQKDCNILCNGSSDPNVVSFSVNLNRSCHERVNIRCSVRTLTGTQGLDLDKYHVLLAQSDPPEILIEDGDMVVGLNAVPIGCRVTNRCDPTRLEITGIHMTPHIYMTPVSMQHTMKGNRFTTIAKTSAVFSEAGNYTITCREAEKGEPFSRNMTIIVNPAEQEQPEEQEGSFRRIAALLVIMNALLLTLAGFIVYHKKTTKRERDMEGIADEQQCCRLLIERQTMTNGRTNDRYRKIENKIQQLTFWNIDDSENEISQILREGDITYPEKEPSIIYQLVGKCDKELITMPRFFQLIQDLTPSYRESALSQKEDLSEVIWKHLKSFSVDSESEASDCIDKLKIFLPLDDGLSTRLLWMFVMHAKTQRENLKWNSHFAATLKFLIRKGANPIAKHEETSAFTLFLEESDYHLQDAYLPSVESFIEESVKIWDSSKPVESVLNDVIKAVPRVILEENTKEISSIKERVVKICLEMIDTNSSLCNHLDDAGKTPLHNLMEKLFTDDDWKRMPKFVEGTDSLLNLMSRLINETNVTIKDKDDVTPYLWLLRLKESAASPEIQVSERLVKRTEDILKCFDDSRKSKEDAFQQLKYLRYKMIDMKIQHLCRSNIEEETAKILDILNEGEIHWPSQGPPVLKELIEEMDTFYQEPSYGRLLKALYQHCQQEVMSRKEDPFDVIWQQFKLHWIRNEAESKECISKLKIVVPLEADFGTRLLYNLINRCDGREKNIHFVKVLTFLIREGADPFQSCGGMGVITLILEKICPCLSESLMHSVTSFLEEAFTKWEVSKTEKNIVNDIIKIIPTNIVEGDSTHSSFVKEAMFRNCLNLIRMDPTLCDYVDAEGRTPIHNLMEKLLIDDLWKRIPDLTAGNDSLWNLISQLVTEKNVNIQDKDKVTPYSWILMWQELARFHDATDKQKLTKKIEDVKKHFRERGASDEEAILGQNTLLWRFQSFLAMEPIQELMELTSKTRYRRLEESILKLSSYNIEQETKEILEILEEGEVIYPPQGSSVINELIQKTDQSYQEPCFATLVKNLYLSYQSYQRSCLSRKEDLFDHIWEMFESTWIADESDAESCIAKLKIFLPLDATFSTRFLYKLIHHCHLRTIHFVEVLTFLIREGADPFRSIGGMSVITWFLERLCPSLSVSLMPPVMTFLEEAFKKWEVSETEERLMNEIIKSVPISVYKEDSSNLFSVKEAIVRNCLEMIERKPAFCDHVDGEGRTPLHNLMEKLVIEDLWKQIPDFVAGTDSLWNLMSELITDKNVNIRDKDQVTPCSWILWWHESALFNDSRDKQKITKKIEDIIKEHFQEQEYCNKDALQGLKVIREREMEMLLKRLMKLKWEMEWRIKTTETDMERSRTSEEIIAELEKDMERIRDLKNKGCGECTTQLTRTEDFKELAKKHVNIRNDRIFEISESVLQVMIAESNAQPTFDMLVQHKREMEEVNYYALFDVMKWCLDKGAHPTVDQIHEISLLNVSECKTHEALMANIQMLLQLIGTLRKKGNTEPIKIYLNPIQDQWKVGEDLRSDAGAVIRDAYRTLSNCMKSKSVINTLLFLSKHGRVDDVKKCFEEADALLQRDVRDSPVTKWVEDKGKQLKWQSDEEREQEKELRWTMIKRNDNWLRRSVLHLAAIFCHDEKVLNSIAKEMIKGQIDQRDLNGCTPMHLAHLHDNCAAIRLLECHNAKVCDNYLGNHPGNSKASEDTHYKNYSSDTQKNGLSVFDNLKKMLIMPVQECLAIEENLKELFTRMVANDGFLNAEIVMGGSVREKLKVGRRDEFDLQIISKIKPYGNSGCEDEPFACLRLHEHLVKKMAEVDAKGISLQCVGVGDPWKFIWEGEGSCKGREISVNVVLIHLKGNALIKEDRQQLVIDSAPGHQPLKLLNWKELDCQSEWKEYLDRDECDILDNLPPGCRLGILICNALLETLDKTSKTHILNGHVTSCVIKNSLFWLLAGITPKAITQNYGNVFGERYGALRLKLDFTQNESKWMAEEDVERFAEEGRFWAENIFDAIQFVARDYRIIPASFLVDSCNRLDEAHEVLDVLDTCGRCLEKLRPSLFFAEDICAPSDGHSIQDVNFPKGTIQPPVPLVGPLLAHNTDIDAQKNPANTLLVPNDESLEGKQI